jgi:hypothetical protein
LIRQVGADRLPCVTIVPLTCHTLNPMLEIRLHNGGSSAARTRMRSD